MPFKSETYRVLIASPSDLAEEREAATQVVNDWNAEHAVAESVVLLPVRWETHAMPEAGVRPQEAINRQLVQGCDVLVGMFWTKLGSSTGVAESGTVEEINLFVGAGKPAMLYFSGRPIDPNKIDLRQHRKLRAFKESTYKIALSGTFANVDELRHRLSRDLMRQIRAIRAGSTSRSSRKNLDEAFEITNLIRSHREQNISPEEYQSYRELVMGRRRRSSTTHVDPIQPGEVGPNGHRVGYLPNGDKVEWLPSDDEPGAEWPMLLRRNDKAILDAYKEFWDKVWYHRHMLSVSRQQAEGEEPPAFQLEAGARVHVRIDQYPDYEWPMSDFDLGMISGKLSALSWVMGSEWNESLDT